MSHGSEKVNFCCKQCRCFKGEREAARGLEIEKCGFGLLFTTSYVKNLFTTLLFSVACSVFVLIVESVTRCATLKKSALNILALVTHI